MKLFGIVVTALLLMSPMAFSSTELVCYHQTQSRNYSTLSVRVELSDDYESLKFEVLTSGRGDPFSPMKGEKATLQRHQSGKGWLSYDTEHSWDQDYRAVHVSIFEDNLKLKRFETSMQFSRKGYASTLTNYGMTCFTK